MFGEYYDLIFNYLQGFNDQLKQDINKMIQALPQEIVAKCKAGKDFEDINDVASYYLSNMQDYEGVSMEFGSQDPASNASYLLNLSANTQEFFDDMQIVDPQQNKLTNFANGCEIASFNRVSEHGDVMIDYTLEVTRQADGYHAVLTRSEYEGGFSTVSTTEKKVDVSEIMPFVSSRGLS